jgi:hypothetical protein
MTGGTLGGSSQRAPHYGSQASQEEAMSSRKEKRRFTRVDVGEIAVEVSRPDGTRFQGTVRDMGVSSVYVLCTEKVEPGNCCDVDILLGERRIRIECIGKSVRQDENGIAFAITDINFANFRHFHNLLLYNAPDRQVVEEELQKERTTPVE